MGEPEQKPNSADSDSFRANRRRRSIALGLVLAAVVVVFYVLTLAKLGPAVFQRTM